jgi:autotransporter-associated beta strand protein
MATNAINCTRLWFGLLTVVVAWLPLVSSASTYYVATNGADTNSGTLGQPFLTIQKAANVMAAGDTVFIRGGTYRESVTPVNSGTSSAARITYQAYSNEIVTISGADIITNSWTVYSGNIYSNTMNWDLSSNNQVFVDGQMINEARFPNTTLDVSHPVKLVATAGTYTGTSGMQTGTVFNASITQPTNYWVGGTINITIGKVWNSQTCPVIGSGTGQVSFAFTPGSTNYLPNAGNPFFLFGKLSEVDSPGEWFFTNNTLYLWPPQSDNPAGHLVEAKHRMLGLNLSGNSWITVSNIHFVACAVATSSGTKNCVLNQLDMIYPVQLDQMGAFTQGTNAGVTLLGSSNVLQNSLIAYSSGSGVYVAGTNNVVTNNLIHDVDYSGNSGAGISTSAGYRVFGGTNTVIAGNTIYNTGGCPMDLGGITAGYVHHNDLSLGGLQITDFGAIYQYTTAGQGTRIAYNLCHDVDAPSNVSGITNNNSKGIYLDGGSTGFIVDHNVIWNAFTGIVLNSGNITNSAHLILNNTVLGDATSVGWSATPELGTVFQNNIFRTNNAFGLGSVATNNLLKSTDPKFVNAAANNFQLQSGSPAIDAGLPYSPYTDGFSGSNPDQGAYEFGQAAWMAGSTVNETPAFSNLSSSQSVTYGTTNITLSGMLSARLEQYPADGEIVSITINGQVRNTAIANGNGSFSCSYNPATNPVAGSPYAINYFYAGNGVFNAASNSSTTLTINPAPLSITASNVAKIYDGLPYSGGNGVSFSGFVNGENSNVLGGTLNYGGTSQGAVAIGIYSIIPSGLTASNYSLTYSNGTLTISPLPARNLVWDIVGSDGAAISNGSGTWDTTNTNWNNGASNVVWNNYAPDNATFGKGTNTSAPWVTTNLVTIGAPVSVGNMTFTNWNGSTNIQFQITNGTLTLVGAPLITTRSDGLIASTLAGTGFTKSGSGTLILSGTNTYSGNTIATSGILKISSDGNLGSPPALATPGNLVLSNATLYFSGSMTLDSRRGIALGPTTGQGSGFIQMDTGVTINYGGVIANNGGGIGNLYLANNSGQTYPAGTLVFNGHNTFTGTILNRQSILSISSINTFNGVTNNNGGISTLQTAGSNLGVPRDATAAGSGIELGYNSYSGTLLYTGPGEGTDRAITIGGGTGGGGGGTIENDGTGPLVMAGTFITSLGSSSQNKTLTLQGSNTDLNEIKSSLANASSPASTTNLLSLVKAQSGNWILSGTNTYGGNTTVSGGTLNLSGSISNTTLVLVTNSATLQLSGGQLTANILHIYTNAFLLGCGKITGVLINDGTVVSDCGTNLTLTGAVTNNGTMRITGGTQLIASGPFVNNGLLDIINAAGSLPSGFVNNGVVLDSTSVRVLQSSVLGQDFLAQILSAVGHTYQLQRSASLSPASWSDIGTSQTGTGASLTFTNSGALAQPQGFYRFKVN